MSGLLDLLGLAGNVVDTPGSVVRGLLAGDPGRALGGVFDPSQRVSGRDMLQSWGAVGDNQEGFDAGDVLGFGAELATDPLNWLGAGMLGKLGLANKAAEANNARRAMMLEKGAMPAEVAAITKAVDETGAPQRLFHGSPYAYDAVDPNKLKAGSKSFFMATDPAVASDYADAASAGIAGTKQALEGELSREYQNLGNALNKGYPTHSYENRIDDFISKLDTAPSVAPNVRTQFLDTRNPFHVNDDLELAKSLGGGSLPLDQSVLTNNARNLGHDAIHFATGNDGEVWTALNPDKQIYSPWVAPAQQDLRKLSPLMAVMALQNSMRPLKELSQ